MILIEEGFVFTGHIITNSSGWVRKEGKGGFFFFVASVHNPKKKKTNEKKETKNSRIKRLVFREGEQKESK
jgi:hypothetical protein